MDQKKFDEIIRNQVEAYEADLSEMNWSSFKSTMPSDIADDASFDVDIKNKMNGFVIDSDENHWEDLREILISNKKLREQIFTMKAMEGIIALFMLVLFMMLFNLRLDTSKKIFTPSYESNDSYAFANKNTNSDKLLNQQESSFLIKSKPNTSVADKENVGNYSMWDATKSKNSKPNIGSNSLSSELYSAAELTNNYTDDINVADNNSDRHLLASIANLDNLELTRGFSTSEMSNVKGGIINVEKKNKYFITVQGGLRQSIVDSPFDPVYRTEAYQTKSNNFQVGVTAGRKWDKLAISLGFRIMKQSYAPQKIEEILQAQSRDTGPTVQSLSNINFTTLSIPVALQYDLLNFEKSNLYAMLGIEANMIAQADYTVDLYSYGESSSYTTSLNDAIENSNLDRKNFNGGYLQSNNLDNNFYWTAAVGAGYNFQLSENISLLSEVKYHKAFSPHRLGPNNDRLHGLSVDLGARYSF